MLVTLKGYRVKLPGCKFVLVLEIFLLVIFLIALVTAQHIFCLMY